MAEDREAPDVGVTPAELLAGLFGEGPAPKYYTFEVRDFDARKNGPAYVALLSSLPGGKIDRLFFQGGSRRYDSKRKLYSQDYEISLSEGDVVEARLSDGSWKNDYREWWIVRKGALIPCSYHDAARWAPKVPGKKPQ